MTSLTVFKNDGIELVIDTLTGEAFATQAGYARMSGKDKSTISKRIKGVESTSAKRAEIHTEGGLQGVVLITEDLICDWLPGDNPNLTKNLLKLGTRSFLHKLAGYEVKSTAISVVTPATYIEALEALVASEKAKELLRIENEQLTEEVEELSEAVDELFNYSSIVRIAKFNNICEKNFNWRKLKAASTALKVEIKKVPCPRYGTKNLYSHDAWRFVYPDATLPETTTLTLKSA